MANTFRKIYKKTGSSGTSSDYQLVGNVGVDGVELDIMKGATTEADGELGLVPKPTAGQENYLLSGGGIWIPFSQLLGDNDISEIGDGTVTGAIVKLDRLHSYQGSDFEAYQGITINEVYTRGIKRGYVANIQIRFTTPSSTSGMNTSLRMIQLPFELHPALTTYPMIYEIWGTGAGKQCELCGYDQSGYTGHIRPVDGMKGSTDYLLTCTYVTGN